MLDLPLHNSFFRSLHKPSKTFNHGQYRQHLMRYRRQLENAQRFVLNDSAVWEIVERADLDLADLMDRVQLANLPFDDMWLEYSQHEKVSANYAVGRGPKPNLDTVSRKVGFLIRRAAGPEQWIATRVVDFSGDDDTSKFIATAHGLSMFDYMFDAASNAPIVSLAGQRSLVNDLPPQLVAGQGFDAVAVARGLWGARFQTEDDPLEEADKKATIAFNPIWKAWYDHWLEKKNDPQTLANLLVEEFMELRGEFRFLVTALAIMNEVPILLKDSEIIDRKFYGGGRMQPYMTHRTVTINVPNIGRKKRSVADYLRIAASKKRRHMVRGHFRRFRDQAGNIIKESWVEAHARGSAELGWVNHDYDVQHKDP